MSAAMMQAWIWRQFGALDGLQPEMRPVPQPGPGEVLLRVRANSLNQRDLMAARGALPRNGQPNVVPLCDGAGEVLAKRLRTRIEVDEDKAAILIEQRHRLELVKRVSLEVRRIGFRSVQTAQH